MINLADKSKESVQGLRKFLLEQTAKGNDRSMTLILIYFIYFFTAIGRVSFGGRIFTN